MAGYGVFLAACGFEYHGPKGRLGFDPRLRPENFQCAFTAAEGWGTFRQVFEKQAAQYELTVRWGQLRLRALGLTLPEGARPGKVNVKLGDRVVPAAIGVHGGRIEVRFAEELILPAGETLELRL
jgi:hypothetical protein